MGKDEIPLDGTRLIAHESKNGNGEAEAKKRLDRRSAAGVFYLRSCAQRRRGNSSREKEERNVGKAPRPILDLVDHFARVIESNREPTCNEAQVRSELIELMFEALGWDPANRSAAAGAHKDSSMKTQSRSAARRKRPTTAFASAGLASSSPKQSVPLWASYPGCSCRQARLAGACG